MGSCCRIRLNAGEEWASLRHAAVAATEIFRNRQVATSIVDAVGEAINVVAYRVDHLHLQAVAPLKNLPGPQKSIARTRSYSSKNSNEMAAE